MDVLYKNKSLLNILEPKIGGPVTSSLCSQMNGKLMVIKVNIVNTEPTPAKTIKNKDFCDFQHVINVIGVFVVIMKPSIQVMHSTSVISVGR